VQEQSSSYIDRIFREILPLLAKSPIGLFSIFVTFLIGYGVSFLLLDYRRNPEGYSNWLHLSLGGGYTALVFLIVNWSLVFHPSIPLTLDDLAQRAPQTMVISFAILFVAFCAVTLIRDRQRTSP